MAQDKLALAMETRVSDTGRWVRCADREPEISGTYYVIRRGRGRTYYYDRYSFTGYWVTRGHSVSTAVEAWWDSKEDEAHV